MQEHLLNLIQWSISGIKGDKITLSTIGYSISVTNVILTNGDDYDNIKQAEPVGYDVCGPDCEYCENDVCKVCGSEFNEKSGESVNGKILFTPIFSSPQDNNLLHRFEAFPEIHRTKSLEFPNGNLLFLLNLMLFQNLHLHLLEDTIMMEFTQLKVLLITLLGKLLSILSQQKNQLNHIHLISNYHQFQNHILYMLQNQKITLLLKNINFLHY